MRTIITKKDEIIYRKNNMIISLDKECEQILIEKREAIKDKLDYMNMYINMKNIACSTGSACTSASLEPSHVITALGYDTELAHTAIRFSLGRFNNADEIAAAGNIIINAATAAKQKKSNYL